MKYTKLLALMGFVVLFATACSPRLQPFTEQLYDENKWSEEELKSIQFYVSDDIVLHRGLTNGSSKIVGGEIKVVNGRKVEEIVIREGTPGVLLFSPKENRFAVSFEDGGDDRYLIFGPSKKVRNGRFTLRASEWNRNRGKVTYGGETFTTQSTSAFASLMVDLKRIRKVSKTTRTAGGRTVK